MKNVRVKEYGITDRYMVDSAILVASLCASFAIIVSEF